MADRIRIRRGNLPDLPTLQNSELGLATDVNNLYIGSPTGNILINPVKGDADGYTINGLFYNTSQALNLGTSAATSNSLIAGDILVGNDLEVDGVAYFDGYVIRNSGTVLKRTTSASDVYIDGAQDIIAITSTGADRSVFLPDATTLSAGHALFIKDEGGGAAANNITILPADGGQTIDGGASVTISANYGAQKVYTDGSDWFTL